jgi:hypothetical protein
LLRDVGTSCEGEIGKHHVGTGDTGVVGALYLEAGDMTPYFPVDVMSFEEKQEVVRVEEL